jgi:hypothetical protein
MSEISHTGTGVRLSRPQSYDISLHFLRLRTLLHLFEAHRMIAAHELWLILADVLRMTQPSALLHQSAPCARQDRILTIKLLEKREERSSSKKLKGDIKMPDFASLRCVYGASSARGKWWLPTFTHTTKSV